nr:hypothetical protein [Kribbella albertanoniae]
MPDRHQRVPPLGVPGARLQFLTALPPDPAYHLLHHADVVLGQIRPALAQDADRPHADLVATFIRRGLRRLPCRRRAP